MCRDETRGILFQVNLVSRKDGAFVGELEGLFGTPQVVFKYGESLTVDGREVENPVLLITV